MPVCLCTYTAVMNPFAQHIHFASHAKRLTPQHVHTCLPSAGNQNEIYIELVQGFGEALVGNFPGSALRSVVDKEPLQTLAHSLSDSQSLEAAVRSLPDEVARVSAYPSKSVKLVLPDQATVVKSGVSSAIIFRSDSNGEDLEGYVSWLFWIYVIQFVIRTVQRVKYPQSSACTENFSRYHLACMHLQLVSVKEACLQSLLCKINVRHMCT